MLLPEGIRTYDLSISNTPAEAPLSTTSIEIIVRVVHVFLEMNSRRAVFRRRGCKEILVSK